MTASPHRVRSQNTENSPNSGPLAPSSGPSRVDVAHLRALPPTLFRLRNLNVSAPVKVESGVSQATTNSMRATNQTTESFKEPLIADGSKSEPIPQKESQGAAEKTPIQKSLVSRLSSQSIVLFLILAIAVMGIVIGNRDGEDGTENGSQMKEMLLADETSPNDAVVLTEEAVDSKAGVAKSENDLKGPPKSSTTKHADLAAKPSEQEPSVQTVSPDTVADVQDSVTSDETDLVVLAKPAQASTESASLPRSGTQEALVTETAQTSSDPKKNDAESKPNASVALLGAPALVEPSGKQNATNAEELAGGKAPSSTVATSSYTQTRTPAGVSDWLSYLPTVDGAIDEPGTLAVSETPQSPIASYQQYLDSLIQSDSPTATPVGYLQDSDGSPYTGTQSQLPVPSNTTQRR